jgi:hypothetical protein
MQNLDPLACVTHSLVDYVKRFITRLAKLKMAFNRAKDRQRIL